MNAIFYPAIFHPEETGYSVEIPDIEVPFDMEEYEKRYRPVKKTLSIPGWLNDAAESAHINFSGVLQDALKEKLHLA